VGGRTIVGSIEPGVGIEQAAAAGRCVVLCDHASNAIPTRLGTLGLQPSDLERHIAFDPGALPVARHLAGLLDAPLIYGLVSRLVIDCNRALEAPDLIPEASEDTPIPGNLRLDPAERRRRIAEVYEPFHRAIADLLDRRAGERCQTALVSVHSFTPVYRGLPRPWHVGVVFAEDRRLAGPVLAGLRLDPDLVVGENQPYGPADRVFWTLHRHGEARGLATAMIEIRNDLLASDSDQRAWAERLARILEPRLG
jgi:predicted N-formylglutamate amidohydrolase